MSNVIQFPPAACPDCGTAWPRLRHGERCTGCLLSPEEMEVASAFLDELERRARL